MSVRRPAQRRAISANCSRRHGGCGTSEPPRGWSAGIALVTVATDWLLALTQTIVMHVIAAAVITAVASPIVAWLKRHRVGRGLGAALVLLGVALLTAGIVLLLIGGILSQSDDLSGHLSSARTH